MLTRNLSLKLAALALAVFLWFWVLVREQNLIPEQTYRATVTAENVQRGLAVSGDLLTTEVKLRGLREDVEQAGRSVTAYVACRGLGPGRHQLPVRVRVPGNVTVVSVRPSNATVVLEEIVTEGRAVELKLVGEPSSGYELVSVEASPRVVEVAGLRSAVERASRAQVTVDRGRAIPEVPVSLPVEVLDSSGNPAPGVRPEPPQVNVLATLKLVVTPKTVPVVVRTRGSLPSDLTLTSIRVEPPIVTVLGRADRVQEVRQVETEELALSGVSESFTRTLRLVVPGGVSILSGQSVRVAVKVAKPQPLPTAETQEEPRAGDAD